MTNRDFNDDWWHVVSGEGDLAEVHSRARQFRNMGSRSIRSSIECAVDAIRREREDAEENWSDPNAEHRSIFYSHANRGTGE